MAAALFLTTLEDSLTSTPAAGDRPIILGARREITVSDSHPHDERFPGLAGRGTHLGARGVAGPDLTIPIQSGDRLRIRQSWRITKSASISASRRITRSPRTESR